MNNASGDASESLDAVKQRLLEGFYSGNIETKERATQMSSKSNLLVQTYFSSVKTPNNDWEKIIIPSNIVNEINIYSLNGVTSAVLASRDSSDLVQQYRSILGEEDEIPEPE